MAPAAKPAAEKSGPQPKSVVAGLHVPAILLEGDEPVQRVSGPGEKFALSPEPPVEKAVAQTSELPKGYGTGKLLLTARDPHCLYAHWDLSPEQQRQYTALAVDDRLVLRVYAGQRAGQPLQELQTPPEAQHAFVPVDQAGTTYVTEMGYYLPGRQWVSVASSGQAMTPPDRAAEDVRIEFAAMPPLAVPQLPPQPLETLLETKAPLHPVSIAPPAGELAEAVGPSPGGPALRPDIPFAWPAGLELPVPQVPPEEAGAEAPDLWPPAETPEEVGAMAPLEPQAQGLPLTPVASRAWTLEQEQALTELLTSVLLRQRGISSAEVLESQAQARLIRPEAPAPAPEELSLPAPSSAAVGLPIPMGGEAMGISSPAGRPQEKRPGFWFNVNAELVIYGATERDARVMIGGRPIRLRPDGTFSYRFALPDGEYQLQVTAVSRDEDRRSASLEFGRRTEYRGEVGAHPQDPALKTPKPEHV